MTSAVYLLERMRSLRQSLYLKQIRAVLIKEPPPAPVFEDPEAAARVSFISRLPNELLLHILEFVKRDAEFRIPDLHIQGPPAGIASHVWINLTLVCRKWHTLILTTQSFWRVIESCSYQATKVHIERSGNTEIEISYSDSYLEADISNRDATLSLLFANIERARSLWLFGTCSRRFLREVAPYRATPALQFLRLQICEPYKFSGLQDKSDHLCDAFISDVSKLRGVDLGGINVTPTSRIFSRTLTSLSLESFNLPHVGRFTFSTMVSLLQKMPNLEALTLKNMLRGDNDVLEPLRLPLLRKFHLCTFSYVQICSFMQHLELPPSTNITCRCWCNTPEDLVSSLPALPRPRPFSKFHISCTGSEVGLHGRFDPIQPTGRQLPASSGTFSLHIWAEFFQSVHVPALILSLLRPLNDSLTCVNKLSVMAVGTPTNFDWAPLFRPFDAVDEISIRGASTEWHLFAHALAKTVPVPSSEEDLRFMCPRLRALSFAEHVCEWHTAAKSKVQLHPTFFDALANALEMRRAYGGRVSEVTIGEEIVQVGKIRTMKPKAGKWSTKWKAARR
ncbi:hypothetical protein DENSPDRAFT_613572 [Dentipellis sp. KUC8613]|nr:hypothetical protein DENSPDRAFT_613572 [Dentipellis sp. KUC8613]